MAAGGCYAACFRAPGEASEPGRRRNVRWRPVPHPGYGHAVSSRPRQPVRFAEAFATRQRRLLVLDGIFAMALLEAPLAGISSEAVAIAPLLVVSLAALHALAAVRGRR